MTLRAYRSFNFRQDTLDKIGQASGIIQEYQSQGFQLTLRQLYYQHVARGLIENTERSYKALGGLISDARLAGLISWDAIEDRTRSLRGLQTHRSPAALLRQAAKSYRRDLWEGMPIRPEVWVEKNALAEVVGTICNRLRVDFFPCVGYVSQSEQWAAGQRLAGYYKRGQQPIVFHLGDHDPSGLDMTRDNRDRLSMFAGCPVQVVRLALNRDQVDRFQPPPNPAKVTDSRFADYQREHGDESWELDALEPQFIQQTIEDALMRVRDERVWGENLGQEAAERQLMSDMIEEMGYGG